MLDTVIGSKFEKIIFNKMFEKGHNKFRIFTDDFYISRTFNCNSLIVIATFIETNHNFIFKIISDGKLTLATISLSVHIALYEFIKLQLLELFVFFHPSHHFTIFKELSIIVFNDSINFSYFGSYLLFIRKAVKRRYNILNFRVTYFFPLLLSCFYFLLFRYFLALFDSDKILLRELHSLLR